MTLGPSDTALEGATHRVGDITVTRVCELYGPGFAPAFLFPAWDQAVLDEHRGWMIPGCLDEAGGRFVSSIHSWVVRTHLHTVLVDTCVGNHKHRPSLPRFHELRLPFLDRLAAVGVVPEAVDYVLCTHLHADHCGWNTKLVDGRWVPTFPNARYVFSKAEQSHWSGSAGHDGFNAGVYTDSVLPVIEAGQALVIDGEGEIEDGVTLHPTPGHTAGHMAIRLRSNGEEALFSGDIMHQPIQIYHPDWNSRFCEQAEAARASRRWVLDHAAERRAILFSSHFALSSAGRVDRHGDRFSWRFL